MSNNFGRTFFKGVFGRTFFKGVFGRTFSKGSKIFSILKKTINLKKIEMFQKQIMKNI